MNEATSATPARRYWMLLPVAGFAALALIFMVALQGGDPSKLPSALIGKPVPRFELPPLSGLTKSGAQLPGLSSSDLARGKISIVNVWASWCVPCRQEHPQLEKLATRTDTNLVGINYKDSRENAVRFLNSLGNPFSRIGVDGTGRAAVEWGVYGVPETFIVDGHGKIVYKFTGPILPADLDDKILPAIAGARSAEN